MEIDLIILERRRKLLDADVDAGRPAANGCSTWTTRWFSER